jgi:hypothetical protein
VVNETAIKQYYDNHRWFVIGGLAAAAAAFFGFVQIRKGSTPIAVTVATPAAGSSGGSQGYSPADVLTAYQTGAAASTAGAAPAVSLGQGGLDLASSALESERYATEALASSQAQMGGTLAGTLQTIFTQQPAAIPVAAQPASTPAASVAAAAQPSQDPTVSTVSSGMVNEYGPDGSVRRVAARDTSTFNANPGGS